MTVLTLTTRLLSILVINVCLASNGLFVGYLRCAYVCLYLELTEKSVYDDLEVKLAHSGDDGLSGLLGSPCSESRVFFSQLSQRNTHLFLTCLSLRLDSELDNRLREFHGFEYYGELLVAESVTRSGIFQTDSRGDVACVNGLDVFSVVRVHLNYTSDSLVLVLRSVVNAGTCLKNARIYSEEAELSYEGVGSNLERESCKRLFIARRSFNFFAGLGVNALDVGNVDRCRHIVNDSVEQLLYALVFIGSTAGYGNHCVSDGRLSDNSLHLINSDLFVCKELLSNIVIYLSEVLDKVVAIFLSLLHHVLRYIGDVDVSTEVVSVDIRLHFQQVDDALEIFFSADRQLDRNSVSFKSVMKHIKNVVEVSAHNIHLVYINHSGDLVVISLTPNCFGLRLNASLSTENGYGSVEYTERSFNLYGEVNVSRGVDDVESVTLPVASSSSGGDCDTSLLLLCHPVHRSCTLVSFSNFMVYTGIKQDTLGRGCFTGVNMSHDTNISGILQ